MAVFNSVWLKILENTKKHQIFNIFFQLVDKSGHFVTRMNFKVSADR